MTTSGRSPANDCLPTLELFPTSSLGRPPAKTSAAPTPKAKASKASGRASSSKPSALSEKSDLVGSLLRTALISELEALTPCSARWRESTTPAGRPWFVVETSAPTTTDRALGSSAAISPSLPTPIASFQMGGQSNPGLKAKGVIYPAMGPLLEISAGRMDPGRFRGDMEGWAFLPTPRKSDAHHGPEIAKANTLGSTGVSLVTTLTMGMLPTPMASDGMKDGAGGGAGSTYPFRKILSTPRASDMKAGGHGDTGRMGTVRHQLQVAQEALPTPTKRDKRDKRDKRMDRWSPAYDKRKSPTMDAVLDGAMTDHSPDKWAYARQIASLLSSTGLTGPSMTLPVTYGWMMGYPPGWLSNALRSAVLAGRLPLASSSKRSATPSSRKSRKP